jgi:hypothetical protein
MIDMHFDMNLGHIGIEKIRKYVYDGKPPRANRNA